MVQYTTQNKESRVRGYMNYTKVVVLRSDNKNKILCEDCRVVLSLTCQVREQTTLNC